MTIYDTPKSDLDNKQENHFKGWLKFFYIINFVWLIFLPLGSLVYILSSMLDSETSILSNKLMFYVLELTPDFIFSILILRSIKIQNTSTPESIKKLMSFELAAKLIIGILIYMAYKNGIAQDKPSPFFFSIIYYLIWSNYFKKSKRVFNYYGANSK